MLFKSKLIKSMNKNNKKCFISIYENEKIFRVSVRTVVYNGLNKSLPIL